MDNQSVWKPIALVLVTILLTGAPGIVYALRTWTVADDLSTVRDRQDNVRDRLASLEAQVNEMQEDIARIELGLQAHSQQGTPSPTAP